MSLYLHGLSFLKRQKIKLHGTVNSNRTIDPPENRPIKIPFLEIGRNSTEMIGVYSQDLTVNNINTLRLNFSDVSGLDLQGRIKFFKDNFPEVLIFEIELNDIENLLEWEDKNKIIGRPITIDSTVELKWDN